MKNTTLLIATVACILLMGNAPASSQTQAQLARMSPAMKMQAQEYFRANSLEFSSIFRRFHPGPYWILKHQGAFRLNASQLKQEERLKTLMAISTIADNRALQHAYATYAHDAAAMHPAAAALQNDVTLVGKATAQLAREMIPYHLRSYALLNVTQKSTYAELAATSWSNRKKEH